MEFCKHLSYERSLHPGKAVFYYRTENSDFEPLQVEITRVRGQKCSYSEAYFDNDGSRSVQPSDLAYSNPITFETCYVPPLVETLFCRFSLRVFPKSLEPMICGDPEVRHILKQLAENYKNAGGYFDLATRYSKNILTGAWLWRNKAVRSLAVEVVTSNGGRYQLSDGHYKDWKSRWHGNDKEILQGLAREMEEGLTNPKGYFFADIVASIKTEFCQEIFPSQVFLEKNIRESGGVSRKFLKVKLPDGREAACFGAEKVGAALQTIDDWWQEEGADYPLRVHEYGADRTNVVAMRAPDTRQDFYSLLRRADELSHAMESGEIPGHYTHFLMSVLVKAGMFQKGK